MYFAMQFGDQHHFLCLRQYYYFLDNQIGRLVGMVIRVRIRNGRDRHLVWGIVAQERRGFGST